MFEGADFRSKENPVLVFIDESGHPRPGDAAKRPVILAACIPEDQVGRLSRFMFGLRRRCLSGFRLSRGEQEGKAVEFLSRRALLHNSHKREYADEFFEFMRDVPLTAFSIVMERPDAVPYEEAGYLQPQFVWLLQRIQLLMEREHPNEFAIPVFDGQEPTQNRRFSDCFTGYLAKTDAGRAKNLVVPTPFFVDSTLTPGVQIADFFAYVVRLSYENDLHRGGPPPGDLYQSAIRRYFNIVKSKTIDFEQPEYTVWGIYTMSKEKLMFAPPREWLSSEEAAEKPELSGLQSTYPQEVSNARPESGQQGA